MNLRCKIVVLAAVASILACRDSVAPPAVATTYVLRDVNGGSLPYVSPIPEAATILSGVLNLDARGNAAIIQRRLLMGLDATDTARYTYKIDGNQIAFEFLTPCPPDAICIAPPKGTIVGGRISLDLLGGGGSLIYGFQYYGPD